MLQSLSAEDMLQMLRVLHLAVIIYGYSCLDRYPPSSCSGDIMKLTIGRRRTSVFYIFGRPYILGVSFDFPLGIICVSIYSGIGANGNVLLIENLDGTFGHCFKRGYPYL